MNNQALNRDWPEQKLPKGHILAQRYRIESRLGYGAMGEVYDAYDENLGREVAVKILPITRTECEEDVERFRRQASSAARIPHPGIVEIYDRGIDDNIHYIVMERLDGQDLGRKIEQHFPLSIDYILRIGIQVAQAVHAAHRRGVIHRDLKPSNVFLVRGENQSDIVKVLDFGVAKDQNSQSFTQTDQIMGTPAYMAPEQLRSAKYVDTRTDVYSIGCILYEMLTGFPPFKARSRVELLLQITNDLPDPLERIRTDLPERLIGVINKAMAKKTSDRFATANLLANALEEIAANLIPFEESQKQTSGSLSMPVSETAATISTKSNFSMTSAENTLYTQESQAGKPISEFRIRSRWSRSLFLVFITMGAAITLLTIYRFFF